MRRFPLPNWPILAAALLGLAPAASGQSPTPPPGANVDMQWGVKIPMRDGVTLNATLYLPRDSKDPQPAVFTLTPYIGDTYLDDARYFPMVFLDGCRVHGTAHCTFRQRRPCERFSDSYNSYRGNSAGYVELQPGLALDLADQ